MVTFAVLCLLACVLSAKSDGPHLVPNFRPPSVPLVVVNPYLRYKWIVVCIIVYFPSLVYGLILIIFMMIFLSIGVDLLSVFQE